MTRIEFMKGWLFLTSQPWGKSYRSTGIGTGEPNPAQVQSEFYFNTFAKVPGDRWSEACLIQGAGDYWPSIDTMKMCLKSITPVREPLGRSHQIDNSGISMEEALKERPDLLSVLGRTLKG